MTSSLQPRLDNTLFPHLSDAQLAALSEYGDEITLAPDQSLFLEGQDEQHFYILLEGQLKVTRKIAGDEVMLAIHDPGSFTGALSLLSGEKSIASGYALGETGARVRRISADDFRRLIVELPEIAGMLLSTMAARRPVADTLLIEREKLASLGKMAAGLAHELNNPASAARRAATELRETLCIRQKTTATLVCLLPDAVWHEMERWVAAAIETRRAALPLSPLERSDREEVIGSWLEERAVPDAWKIAPTLADAGLDPDRLTPIADLVGDAALGPALAWTAARLETDDLLYGIEQSAARIADLVAAIKSYSYMDQAPHQQVDIAQGLENTLTILAHKWRKRGIEVTRRYAPDLPRVEGYGGELNQVWTNLLDNAIDAVPAAGGAITIEVSREDAGHVLVAVTDNGSGIPPEIQGRIFEPFFTTKAPGKGVGLGLDTSYRIITQRHGGDIRAFSHPGETRFEVRLPVRQAGTQA